MAQGDHFSEAEPSAASQCAETRAMCRSIAAAGEGHRSATAPIRPEAAGQAPCDRQLLRGHAQEFTAEAVATIRTRCMGDGSGQHLTSEHTFECWTWCVILSLSPVALVLASLGIPTLARAHSSPLSGRQGLRLADPRRLGPPNSRQHYRLHLCLTPDRMTSRRAPGSTARTARQDNAAPRGPAPGCRIAPY
jgi:hypothetical protein